MQQKLNLPKVPVIVREATDQQVLELALIENLQRAELDPVEEADGYATLIETFGLKQEEVAERVGKPSHGRQFTEIAIPSAGGARPITLEAVIGGARKSHSRFRRGRRADRNWTGGGETRFKRSAGRGLGKAADEWNSGKKKGTKFAVRGLAGP